MQEVMSKFHSIDSTNYWKEFLASYQPNLEYPDDLFALETSKLALQAVELGNFGIGSIIVDPHHKVVARGHNQVFYPYFRSDGHGEMIAMSNFEDRYRDVATMKGYTLYTSLESCPMCMARLITSGCERIIHVADDPLGGMVHLRNNLPPIWIKLAKHQIFAKAQCSRELEEAAQRIFLMNVEELNERLHRHSEAP
jgi:tRNA(Arg) A34 adenosine deaminase TadA